MNRQQRRALKKVAGEKTTTAVDLMLNMPTECGVCKARFDRTNREMVNTWTVKVWNADRKVELFCPEHTPVATEQK
jgi:uncharacterized protein (DUF2225 family)